MTLVLDPRQRAMLSEMGIDVWLPEPLPAAAALVEPVAAPASTPRPVRAPPVVTPLVRNEAPVEGGPLQARATGIESMDWASLQTAVSQCRACPQCQGRKHVVVGSGDLRADWLIVGEPPEEDEDRQGEPFAGAPGQLLDNMLRALQLDRSKGVYLTHALKCRPSASRNPQPADVAECAVWLRRQVELLQPRIILALGRTAVQSLLQTDEPLGKLRGQRHSYIGVPVVVSYNPAALLRNPQEKAKAWADLCLARQILDEPSTD